MDLINQIKINKHSLLLKKLKTPFKNITLPCNCNYNNGIIKETDYGNYSCVATNPLGSSTSSYHLTGSFPFYLTGSFHFLSYTGTFP